MSTSIAVEAERPVAPPVPPAAFAGASPLTITPAAGKADVARWIVALPADAVRARDTLGDVARSGPIVPAGLVPGGMVDVRCAGRRLATYLDAQSLATVAIVPPSCAPVTISPEVPGTVRVALSSGETIVRVPSAEGHFAEGVRVDARQALTVREIIARHQAAAARQRRAVQQLISTGTMTLTFEAPSFPAPMAITSQAIIYTAADATDIEQRDIRVNGIAFAGGRVPRLPLIEPERVASPPLAIALTDVYNYRLEGEAIAGGVRCYTVGFSPIDTRRPLFSGTAWIAMDSFAMVKVSAVQTALRGPIVSSEQTDEFSPDTAGHWLLARSEVHQLYEGAGFRTPIHRVVAVDRQEVNPPSFDERRRQAYASAAVMLRDTPQGFRYLIRETPSDEDAAASKAAGSVSPAPRLAGPSQRVRTVALGVIVDPNISTPLPFAGLSYIDFNLFGTGTQVNGFFGGTYGQLAVSVPSLGGTRWQLAGQAFGIASWYNDRAFVQGREHYEWNISQRPAHAAAWVLRPLSARLTMRAGYELDYTGFDESDSTVSTFAVPAAQVAHGLRLALEGQWNGWTSVHLVGGGAAQRLAPVGRGRRASGARRRGRVQGRAAGLPTGWRGAGPLGRVLVAARRARRGGLHDGPGSRPVQPLHVRQLRQPPARLSLGAHSLRSRRGRPRLRGVVGGAPASAGRFPRLRLRARSRLRAARPQLLGHRRGRGGSRAVRHAGRRRVGLRLSGPEQRRPAGHPGSARHRV